MDRSAAPPPDRRDAPAPVVVGVDGSPSADLAVAAAADEAVRRDTRLIVLHAADPAVYEGGPAPVGYTAAHDVVDRAAAAARSAERPPRVETAVVRATPVGALLDASRGAALVVVGARGLGTAHGLLVGSVSRSLAGRASCPVLIVRGNAGAPARFRRRVLVGVSGAAGRPAVELAVEEARLRGMRLLAMHAWTVPAGMRARGLARRGIDFAAVARAQARMRLAGVLKGVPPSEDVRIRQDVVRDTAEHALVAASYAADLLVIGARRPAGPGPHLGPQLGPVTRAVLGHAQCPVLVVPLPVPDRPEPSPRRRAETPAEARPLRSLR
jgi:nucleotide-binding universal stress UspA family protein